MSLNVPVSVFSIFLFLTTYDTKVRIGKWVKRCQLQKQAGKPKRNRAKMGTLTKIERKGLKSLKFKKTHILRHIFWKLNAFDAQAM